MDTHIVKISHEIKASARQVEATIELLDNDATVPFIARYRKEATGGLDEVAITYIRDRIKQLRELDKRREAIMASLEERELLTDELKSSIEAAETMAELEDIYLPFKPKKRTRATIAREKGLEPLAEIIFEQGDNDPESEAAGYIDEEKGVNSIEEALAGARDIIAEWISEDADARARLRRLFWNDGIIESRVIAGQEDAGNKFSDYFDWSEKVSEIPSHRLLAMRRGENESFLKLNIAPEKENALTILSEMFISGHNACAEQVRLAMEDSYKRLLSPSMENETRQALREKADEEAIRVFTANLRELLMAPALGRKKIMAIDPGFRTGCKLVCLDAQGKMLEYATIQPHQTQKGQDEAEKIIKELVQKYVIEVIAIGNGTAGRETEKFVREIGIPDSVAIEMVNESGASVYSASEIAREEFPELDVSVRGAVSIGRRIMDPLAELVKIDPKSIGVGQYQHDVDQNNLRLSLDDTVISCVNAIGVEVNTASKQLLAYVSGLGPHLAGNIVTFRDTNGPFKSRDDLLRVPRLGPKAFEQAAGFLRIADAINPLDRSAVHPESYFIVEKMAADLKIAIADLIRQEQIRKNIRLTDYTTDRFGLPTLQDIMAELARPGRDPRPPYQLFSFDDSVYDIADLKPGMKLPGVVTNVTNFGAFVDIGVHQDGLIHISQMADKFVRDPNEIVRVHQKVLVTVLEIDLERRRIALSLKSKSDSLRN